MLQLPIFQLWQFFLSFNIIPIFNTFINFLPFSSAQGLNDPSSHYIEGRLGGRRIWWCPSGYGCSWERFRFLII